MRENAETKTEERTKRSIWPFVVPAVILSIVGYIFYLGWEVGVFG